MLKKSLWGIALATIATAGLLLTPDTSQAQRRGGGGFRGGSWGRGGGWGGGYRGGWGRGGWGRGGWGWGGYGLGLGLGYGLGYYGGYPYYDNGYYGSPYYYSSDYYQPSYTYVTPPAVYAEQPTYVSPQASYYGADSQQPANPNSAEITVKVPDPNAEVWFDNYKTTERGAVREFESAPLQPGQNYTYHIRARWNNNGQMVEQTRDVQVRPGQAVNVDFSNNVPPAPRTNEAAATKTPPPNNGQR